MAFLDKYTITPVPMLARSSRMPQTPQERARQRLQDALKVQHALLQAQQKGETYTIKRNGKAMQPRAFWQDTPLGLVFMPRFGNELLFDKAQGVLVADHAALAQVMEDFSQAVEAGEFDTRIVAISEGRGTRAAGGQPRGRGRPRKQA